MLDRDFAAGDAGASRYGRPRQHPPRHDAGRSEAAGGAAPRRRHLPAVAASRRARFPRASTISFQDLRFASRLMIKDRWFSAAAIAAIALGIGANTVGFTIVNAAFLRGFPFEEADRLHAISWRPDAGRSASVVGARSRGLAGAVAIVLRHRRLHLRRDQHQRRPCRARADAGRVGHGQPFDVLRQRPLLGRTFVAGDERRGAEPVVIIGYEIWKNRFDLDPRSSAAPFASTASRRPSSA